MKERDILREREREREGEGEGESRRFKAFIFSSSACRLRPFEMVPGLRIGRAPIRTLCIYVDDSQVLV